LLDAVFERPTFGFGEGTSILDDAMNIKNGYPNTTLWTDRVLLVDIMPPEYRASFGAIRVDGRRLKPRRREACPDHRFLTMMEMPSVLSLTEPDAVEFTAQPILKHALPGWLASTSESSSLKVLYPDLQLDCSFVDPRRARSYYAFGSRLPKECQWLTHDGSL
jgi:hypothetical protein